MQLAPGWDGMVQAGVEFADELQELHGTCNADEHQELMQSPDYYSAGG